MKPLYVAVVTEDSWGIRAQDASRNFFNVFIHGLEEWQARAIAAILNG